MGMDKGNDALWGGRFEASPEAFTQSFGASLSVDRRMWRSDITASQAHARMLGAQGIIPQDDVDKIVAGLDAVAAKIESGEFVFDDNDEDIHMAVEAELTRMIGEAGGRLHTGRSRNDQVATDTRLHVKGVLEGIREHIRNVQRALLGQAEENFGVVMPGYTHMQRAQPVLFSHHMLAYFWMLDRDCKRIMQAYDSADVLPLGSAALAGTTYPLDRRMVAEDLGFSGVTPNSLDAVSDRDFLLDAAYACSVGMIHLSRLCEELVYWSSGEFGFITMSDAYSTGSSIMPQKKNPDFAELIRGKSGRTVGDLVALLVTMKSLPLAYNKDMQEDKEGVFDALDTYADSLHCMAGIISTMRVNADAMLEAAHGGFMAATDLADYLVGKGLPFRQAHEVVGRLVLACEKQGRTLQSLSVDELREHCDLFDEDALEALDVRKIAARRTTEGGTGDEAVKAQIELAKQKLED
ncbi:MAG: argininosuccinate lyase [Coriobacteriales bacterium]|jgi:argininosuccinate lyase